jgi:hypothetical protein
MLAAWLLQAPKHSVKTLHQKAKKRLASKDGLLERQRGREYLKHFPQFEVLFTLERPCRPGEPEEPEVVPF